MIMLKSSEKFKEGEIRLYNCFNGLIETQDYRLFKLTPAAQELINAIILDQANENAHLHNSKNVVNNNV